MREDTAMRIGIIQASSQKSKNRVLENCLRKAAPREAQIINFGVKEDSPVNLSYVQVALCVSLLLESKGVDFVLTGCSSGQGMALACNSLPGVLCGYVQNPTDAYLFGRINDGNAVSYPLGFGWGWAAEINLEHTLEALFSGPFGAGYPAKEAERKRKDTRRLKQVSRLCKGELWELLPRLDAELTRGVLDYRPVTDYVLEHGTDERLKKFLKR